MNENYLGSFYMLSPQTVKYSKLEDWKDFETCYI